MIRINLLPPGVRPSKAAAFALAVPWKKVGAGGGIVAVAISSFFLIGNLLQGRRIASRTAQLQELEPQRLKLEETRLTLQSLQTRAAAIDSIKATEGRWAPRLNLLTDCLVRDMWFMVALFLKGSPSQTEGFAKAELSHLQLDSYFQMPEEFKKVFETPGGSGEAGGGETSPFSRPVFLLGGLALVPEGENASPVTRFIVRLNEHPDFSRWFSGLDLKDIAQVSDSSKEGASAFLISMYPTGS